MFLTWNAFVHDYFECIVVGFRLRDMLNIFNKYCWSNSFSFGFGILDKGGIWNNVEELSLWHCTHFVGPSSNLEYDVVWLVNWNLNNGEQLFMVLFFLKKRVSSYIFEFVLLFEVILGCGSHPDKLLYVFFVAWLRIMVETRTNETGFGCSLLLWNRNEMCMVNYEIILLIINF